MLTQADGKKLLKLARDSILSYFSGNSKKQIDLTSFESDTKFNQKQGVFVTLHKDGDLRGCIGFPYPTFPLYNAIFNAARSAAFEDTRFDQVEQSEMKDIQMEISVLTVPEELKVKSPDDYLTKIKIGEDGLIIKHGFNGGLLLPQVFTEYKSTPKQALEMVCQKAGLQKDAWKEKSAKISKFQAQIFTE
jgi:AmmeMemoRadiSam system protein A